MVFFAALELLGWTLVDAFPVQRRTPLWARICGAVLIVIATFAGAALFTLAAAFVMGFAQAALGRQGS